MVVQLQNVRRKNVRLCMYCGDVEWLRLMMVRIPTGASGRPGWDTYCCQRAPPRRQTRFRSPAPPPESTTNTSNRRNNDEPADQSAVSHVCTRPSFERF